MNMEVITLARENHVDIICLPPHNSHKMQRMDKIFMGPLKTFYSKETEIQLSSNLRRASGHRLPNLRTIRHCIQARCNRGDSG